jgi:hypothetical protein
MAETQDLQKLVVSLEARTTQFEKALNKANATAQRQTRAIENRFKAMNTQIAKSGSGIGAAFGNLKGMLGAAGIAIGVQQIVSGIREILAAADDLVDTSKRLGILPTQLELFRRAAEIGGASAGELDAGLKKLQVNWVAAATKGGAFADFLESQGVALRTASGEIPDLNTQMKIMADLLSRTTDEAQRAAIATLAFGRGAAGLGEAFASGSLEEARREFEKFGQATDEQIQKLAAAHDKIEEFWSAFKRNAAIATAEGITAIESFGKSVTDLGAVTKAFIEDPNVRTFFDMMFGEGAAEKLGLEEPIKNTNDLLERHQKEIAETTAQIELLRKERDRLAAEDATFDLSGFDAEIARLQERIAQLNAEIRDSIGLMDQMGSMRRQAESYVDFQLRRARGETAIPGAPPQPSYSPLPSYPMATVPPKVKADVEIEIDEDSVEDAAEKAGKKIAGSLADELTNAIGAWETRGMTAAQAYAATGAAGEIGRYQIMQANIGPWSREALGYSVSPAAFRASPDLQDRIARFKVGQYLEQYGLEGAIRAWNTGQPGGTTTPGYVQGVMGMLESGAGFRDLQDGISDTSDAMSGLVDKLAEMRSMSEDFLNTFVDGLLEGKSAVEALGDALEELGRSLIKSGIHMLVGSIFPNIPAGGGAGLLQAGGPMWPGHAYKVHRDELIVPRSPMQVIPASRAGGGGGAVALTYAPNINIAGNADDAAIRRMRDGMLADIEQRLPNMVRSAHRDRRL